MSVCVGVSQPAEQPILSQLLNINELVLPDTPGKLRSGLETEFIFMRVFLRFSRIWHFSGQTQETRKKSKK